LAEQEPVERDALAHGERDEEIGVRSGAALVPVHVLLKHSELAGERALRAAAADLGEASRYQLLLLLRGRLGVPGPLTLLRSHLPLLLVRSRTVESGPGPPSAMARGTVLEQVPRTLVTPRHVTLDGRGMLAKVHDCSRHLRRDFPTRAPS